jgi:hypothetical protein
MVCACSEALVGEQNNPSGSASQMVRAQLQQSAKRRHIGRLVVALSKSGAVGVEREAEGPRWQAIQRFDQKAHPSS